MALEGIWVPPTAQEPRRKVRLCRCGMEFPYEQREQWARHCVRCAERNEEEALAHVAAQESSIFTSIGDKERFAYLRKRGAKNALRRKRMKP